MPTSDDLMSTAQVAEALGLTVRHVARLAASGSLPPAVKIEGRTGAYVFRAEVVREYQKKLDASLADTDHNRPMATCPTHGREAVRALTRAGLRLRCGCTVTELGKVVTS
jgi:predicted DNA-binding transcriptional regulator AlpA